ncbi:MAG: methyltransferase domain-containing protein [Deltaproteobacteria bacterium]|nr:MAG: methyltransferase domain-containing protein [Deltaproteobacteria bacterium]
MTARRGARPAFFDLWSRFYDTAPVQWLTYRPVHDALLAALRRTERERVLDVGCGTGILADRICRELPRARVSACDFSLGMLRRANARNRALGWVQGDALRLPFRAGSFDAVVSCESFHWFADPALALGEFFRVLAPGGRLFAALVNPPSALASRAIHAGSRILGEPFYWPTRQHMRRQVEAAGFRLESQRQLYRIPAGLLLPPVLTIALRPASVSGGTRRL